jgi:outer membrane protein TolC
LGIPLDRPVQLKQSLESVVSNTNLDKTVSEDFSVQNTIGYQLADTQVKLEELDLKRQKANFLPNLSAFYNFNENAMRNEFNFFDFDEEWYQSSILGFQLNIPIFSSGQRYSKVKQAQLQLKKAKNNRELAKKNLKNGYIQARNNYMNAYETYISDQENKKLAKKVLDRTNKKYKEGMVTSMELTQANDKYLETQSNYINSLVQLLNAKVQLLKILNAL